MKRYLKSLLPPSVVRMIRRIRQRIQERSNVSRSARDVFSEIYRESLWGTRDTSGFCSGTGSANQAITSPYIEMISGYLRTTDQGMTLVDLGCGDMAIGRNFLDLSSKYVGVDVVPDLVDQHKSTYQGSNAEFLCLDIIDDELPDGDICFVRQVLQHLSNDQIAKILLKLCKYNVCFITEHYPTDNGSIIPNKDIVHGSRTRVYENSGVYLDKPPFNMPGECIQLMLEVPGAAGDGVYDAGFIRTWKIEWQRPS